MLTVYAIFADGVYMGEALCTDRQLEALLFRLSIIHEIFLSLMVALPVEIVV